MKILEFLGEEAHITEINHLASRFNLKNVRVYEPTVGIEKNVVNLLVEVDHRVNAFRTLSSFELAVSESLNYTVRVVSKTLLPAKQYENILVKAVCLDSADDILRLFESNNYELNAFEDPLTEKQSLLEAGHSTAISNSRLFRESTKRKKPENDNHSNEEFLKLKKIIPSLDKDHLDQLKLLIAVRETEIMPRLGQLSA